MSRLTIILPLKDRIQFTQRFLNYTAKGSFPVVIADGSYYPQNFTAKYKHVSYHYYEPDYCLLDYWNKMAHVLHYYVHTPYAMIADNDDFPLPNLRHCIEFLDANPDYIACSGRIQGLWLWPDKISGPFCHITKQYAPFDTPTIYDQADASIRILSGFTNSWSYYAVYHTKALRDIWQGAADLALTDLQVHEKYCAIKALSLGKIKCFGNFASYLRQYETSTRNTNIVEDWKTRLALNTWTRDAVKVVNSIDNVDREKLHRAWSDWYVFHLRYHFGLVGKTRRLAKRLAPSLAYAYQHKHEYIPIKSNIADFLL